MQQETQQQPQEDSQKKLLWKSPSGWRYYSPTSRSRWSPTGRQVLATIATVVALGSLSLIGYFFGWWTVAREYAWLVGLTVAFLMAMTILVGIGYRKRTTGFGDKTLWNWLELLIIPVVLAVGGLLFTMAQDERQYEAEERRAGAQREAEEQRAQDEALQAYFEEMGNLLLGEDLRTSQQDDEASTLARARTLTILGRIDPERKSSVVRFLYESNLIQKDQPIVSLASADLRDIDLRRASLQGADLRLAILDGADLSGAQLEDTDLSNADLRDADLSRAEGVTEGTLERNASSLEGATMPNARDVHD